MQMNFEKLRPHLAMILDVDPITLQMTTVFSDLEQWDSFAMLSIVALVTEHTGKQITIQDVDKIASAGDLVTLLQELRKDIS